MAFGPADFLRIAREEVARYPSVEFHRGKMVDARRTSGGFSSSALGGLRFSTRKLLLATGVVDELPQVEGLPRALRPERAPLSRTATAGNGVTIHSPCTAAARRALRLAIGLTVWSDDVVLCSDGPSELSEREEEALARSGIEVREEPIVRLEGKDGRLERVVFASGAPLSRSALFFGSGQHQRSPLAEKLGAQFNEKGAVDTGVCESTNVPGLYVAGDSSKEAQFVIVAAAEGTQAAMAINKALLKGRSGSEQELEPQTHQARGAVREEWLSKVPRGGLVEREQLLAAREIPIAIRVGECPVARRFERDLLRV